MYYSKWVACLGVSVVSFLRRVQMRNVGILLEVTLQYKSTYEFLFFA
jgi:hypothetical protein